LWGFVFDAIGRRGGLVTGLSVGVVGSGLTFYAIAIHSFPLFLAGMVLMGMANSAVQLGRFAAAEVNKPEHRGRAISNVVIGGTIGAVIGPFVWRDLQAGLSVPGASMNWRARILLRRSCSRLERWWCSSVYAPIRVRSGYRWRNNSLQQ
jgi:MFS family permease